MSAKVSVADTKTGGIGGMERTHAHDSFFEHGPAFLYVFAYADRTAWMLYAGGVVSCILSGMSFPGLDLIYGFWLNGFTEHYEPARLTHLANQTAIACIVLGTSLFFSSAAFLVCFNLAATRTTTRLRRAYLASIIHQDAVFFERVGAGEVGTRLMKDIGIVKTATGEKLAFMLWGLSTLVTALVMAFVRVARLAGFLVTVIPLAIIVFIGINSLSEKVTARRLETDGKASTFLEQILSSVRVVKAFAAERLLISKYDSYLSLLQRDGFWKAAVNGMELSIAYCVLNVIYSMGFWFGSRLIVERGVLPGVIFTCFWNIFNALFAVANILPHITVVMESATISGRLREEIRRVPIIDSRDTSGHKPDPDSWTASISLNGVTFSYPSRPQAKALDAIDLNIAAGQVTALVGASGSGKSTIASLLLRYYDPSPPTDVEKTPDDSSSENRILLSGQDLRSYNLSWLRSQISVVSQDPQLFTATILENIAHGLTGTSLEYDPDKKGNDAERQMEAIKTACMEALVKAQALDFVEKLPQGVRTPVSGGRTTVLSGGQRQRIAVARALVRKPKILILDEGTSALDSETESRLMAAIHAEQKEHGMTTILIAHRLSSIQAADRIIVLDKGKVVEEGTYNSLIAASGPFRNLVEHQMSSPLPQPLDPSTSTVEPTNDLERIISTASYKSKHQHIRSWRSSTDGSALERGDGDPSLAIPPKPKLLLPYFKFVMSQWRFFVPGFLLAITLGASFPIAGWLTGRVVDTFSLENDNARLRREANAWSFWFLMLALIDIVLAAGAGFFLSLASERVSRVLRLLSLNATLRQEVGYFDRPENAPGALTATISTASGNASHVIGLVMQNLVTSGGNLLGALLLGLCLSWKLSLVAFIPLPFIFGAAYINVKAMAHYEAMVQGPLEVASAFATENVDAIRTVAALGRERAVIARFDRDLRRHFARKRELIAGSLGFGFGIASILLVTSIIMWWGTRLYNHNLLHITPLFACVEAVIMAGASASRLFSFIPDISRAVQAFTSIMKWETRTPQLDTLPPVTEDLSSLEGRITFKNCTMKYPTRPQIALNRLNLEIKAGQNVAFCGPSGGGKSSILALINRFYDPIAGTIHIDGMDIRSLPLDQYRSCLALVSQDAVLYEGTFLDNIRLGIAEHTTQEEVEKACREAHILDFILSFPEGFNTNVGIKGAQMSGGQRQRVCIARALLRKPKILLLDEATSALDAESEKVVQEALSQASKGRTTLTIAHRLSTIQGADVIHVVEHGRIVESGSHAELLALKRRYFDLVRSQVE